MLSVQSISGGGDHQGRDASASLYGPFLLLLQGEVTCPLRPSPKVPSTALSLSPWLEVGSTSLQLPGSTECVGAILTEEGPRCQEGYHPRWDRQ